MPPRLSVGSSQEVNSVSHFVFQPFKYCDKSVQSRSGFGKFLLDSNTMRVIHQPAIISQKTPNATQKMTILGRMKREMISQKKVPSTYTSRKDLLKTNSRSSFPLQSIEPAPAPVVQSDLSEFQNFAHERNFFTTQG